MHDGMRGRACLQRPFYVAREIRQKNDGGQPIKESVCNAVGGLVYKTDKPALNKAAISMIHETLRTGIALQLLSRQETKELSEDMRKAAKDKACQFKAFEGWHSLLRTSGADLDDALNLAPYVRHVQRQTRG